MTVCVEAKADESFGGTVAEEFAKAKKRTGTMFPKRLDWLTRWLLGVPAFKDDGFAVLSEDISLLPYQLFSAIGGTLLEAGCRKASKAVFVVHEFRTGLTEDFKLEANANVLNHFLRRMLSANQGDGDGFELKNGQMIGPILITDRKFQRPIEIPRHIPLFIGKIRTDLLGEAGLRADMPKA